MNEILILIALALLSVSALFSAHRQLQMLQQNSYFPSRYYGWLKDSHCVTLALEALFFCAVTLFYTNAKGIITLIAAVIMPAVRVPLAVKQHKSSIKKLVVTARVKRLYVSAVLILAVCTVLCGVLSGEFSLIFRMIGFALASIPAILTLLCWAVTFPIEKAVTNWYINDAKRILKAHSALKVIGVTGSYGKTSTKFILNRILSEKFNVVATPQSFNTPMGVVRTVRTLLKPQTQVFICEMGAKKVGDIKEICDIAHPQYGIITSVGAQHLDTFKSEDNVFATKFELCDEVLKNGGACFVNKASAGIAKREALIPHGCATFGLDANAEYYAEDISYSRNGSEFILCLKGEKIKVSTKLLGLHNVNNIVAAAAIAHELGVTAAQIQFAVSALKATEHRLELKAWNNGSLLIDDAYNANPEGSLEAVRVLGSFDGMRKVIITPGLIELGSREYECNRALGAEAARHCDEIIFVGKNRSKPLLEGALREGYDEARIHVVSSLAEAMSIYAPTADRNSVVLLENDLPDNYLN